MSVAETIFIPQKTPSPFFH